MNTPIVESHEEQLDAGKSAHCPVRFVTDSPWVCDSLVRTVSARSRYFTSVLSVCLLVLAGVQPRALAGPSPNDTAQLSDVPIPSGAQIAVVGDQVIHNGKTVSIATYESPLSIDETIAFYEARWPESNDKQVPGILVSRTDQWVMISRLHEGFNTVIQLQADKANRSTGFLSIMHITEPVAVAGHEFAGFNLLSRTLSRDAELGSTLSVYEADSSVGTVAKQCIKFLQRHDWTLVSEQKFKSSTVLLLNRQAARMEIVVDTADTGGSLIIVNEVRASG